MASSRLQNDSKEYSCVHVVKEGETLSSISKMYEVPLYSIAEANKDIIVDIDLVFKGQLLNIPPPNLLQAQLDRAKSKLWRSIRVLRTPSQQKVFSTLTSLSSSNAKAAGYVLALVPLIAFCIGCIISTFRIRVSRGMKQQAVDKSQGQHPGAKNMRWKSALGDTVEGDVLDSDSGLDSDSPSEDGAYISSEANSRLQHDYQKFLSECGISKCGYWRGGSPD